MKIHFDGTITKVSIRMNPHDERAGLHAEDRECEWCGDTFKVPSRQNRQRYCSDDCLRSSKALRERERVHDLKSRGLCPCCKRPTVD